MARFNSTHQLILILKVTLFCACQSILAEQDYETTYSNQLNEKDNKYPPPPNYQQPHPPPPPPTPTWTATSSFDKDSKAMYDKMKVHTDWAYEEFKKGCISAYKSMKESAKLAYEAMKKNKVVNKQQQKINLHQGSGWGWGSPPPPQHHSFYKSKNSIERQSHRSKRSTTHPTYGARHNRNYNNPYGNNEGFVGAVFSPTRGLIE